MRVPVMTLISFGAYEFEIEAFAEVTLGRPALINVPNDFLRPAEPDEVAFDYIAVSPPVPAEGPWVAMCATEFCRRFGADSLGQLDCLAIEQHKEFSDMMDDRRADYEFDRMRDEEF